MNLRSLSQLDESTARRQLKSPRSLSGRSLHLTLVTKWSRSHMTLKIQISRSWPRSNPCQIWGLEFKSICLLFVSWQSDHFWLRYSKFHIWPWKFKVKVMAKVKSDGHIWGLEFNWCVRFLFRGNRTTFGWDIANFIFDLEIQGQGQGQGQTRWSHLKTRAQSMCLLFVSRQSDNF